MKTRRPDTTRSHRQFGGEAEARLTRRGYTATPGSGSFGAKGDLRRGDVMVEVKRTRADSYRVSAEVMGKLRNDGLANGRDGVLVVELGTGDHIAVMPLELMERLLDAGQDKG